MRMVSDGALLGTFVAYFRLALVHLRGEVVLHVLFYDRDVVF